MHSILENRVLLQDKNLLKSFLIEWGKTLSLLFRHSLVLESGLASSNLVL